MAAIAQMAPKVLPAVVDQSHSLAALEHTKSLLLRAWILTGIFFMALPGTLLGFSNLMAISAHHGISGLPPAWMEGHGYAQVFGWIGSFILGIGFYSQPARGRLATRISLVCLALWSTGVALRWTANIYGWHWRLLVPISAALELIAILLFLFAASHHKHPDAQNGRSAKLRMELWMVSVLLGTTGLTAAVLFNFVECMRLAFGGVWPAFPHALDQRYLVLLGWGFLVPVVWGFSARWLPVFLGIAGPHGWLFRSALLLDMLGVIGGVTATQGLPCYFSRRGLASAGLHCGCLNVLKQRRRLRAFIRVSRCSRGSHTYGLRLRER